MVCAASVPVSTSLLGEGWVESVWLRSAAPMSGRLPAGCGRAWPSWSVGRAASGSPPLSAGLSTLLRSGTMPAELSWPPPVAGSMAANSRLGAMPCRSPMIAPVDVAAEDIVAVAVHKYARHIAPKNG